jgi:segregation and condensation protein B
MSEQDGQNLRLLEAVMFSSSEAMTERALAARLPEDANLKALLQELKALYENSGVNLVKVGKSWAFRTAPDLAAQLRSEAIVTRKLGRATIEVLAVIAYHQPITRAEIEEIRGVGLSKGTLDILFEAGWVKPGGRRKTPGRPMVWVTTDGFLDHFGLENLRDLPGVRELKETGLLDKGPALDVYRVNADEEEEATEEESENEQGSEERETAVISEFSGAQGET